MVLTLEKNLLGALVVGRVTPPTDRVSAANEFMVGGVTRPTTKPSPKGILALLMNSSSGSKQHNPILKSNELFSGAGHCFFACTHIF